MMLPSVFGENLFDDVFDDFWGFPSFDDKAMRKACLLYTSAAYRSGEKLYSEYYGEYSDYTRKRGVICSDILLPPHAPKEYADRQTLWNAVEKAEHGKTAQLAYSFDIALQKMCIRDRLISPLHGSAAIAKT